ncbi:hypothetical protein WDZ92_51705, partial [Nostoc sp. NIES-2111]
GAKTPVSLPPESIEVFYQVAQETYSSLLPVLHLPGSGSSSAANHRVLDRRSVLKDVSAFGHFFPIP